MVARDGAEPAALDISLVCRPCTSASALCSRPRNTWFSRSMKPPPVPIARASMYLSSECEKAKLIRIQTNRTLSSIGSIGILLLGVASFPALAADAEKSPPVKIAVFDFELEDVSPAASLLGRTTSSTATMDEVSKQARRESAHSGRYSVVDVSKVDATTVTGKSLRNSERCEAGIALQLGAEHSLIGVVRKVTQTDYYVVIQIRDARTGKLLDQQEANFAGGEEGWVTP